MGYNSIRSHVLKSVEFMDLEREIAIISSIPVPVQGRGAQRVPGS